AGASVGSEEPAEKQDQRARELETKKNWGTEAKTRIRKGVCPSGHAGRVALELTARAGGPGRRGSGLLRQFAGVTCTPGGESAWEVQRGLPNFPARGREAGNYCLPPSGEKKLGTVITPDTWKDGARNTTESGGRKLNENKALTSKKARFDPYGKNKFSTCRICKSSVHQPGSHYCQGCAYKKGICAMCGKKVLDTKNYKQTSV
uniref:Cysteine-rich PDZ-binding protein n=1 Tax=Macaca fascicularis TaxID=9541 RepID=G7PM54_MACFA